MYEADVFVIGGGPAGLAAAIAASRKGFRVIVADGNRPPIDKACGEGLMPDSLAAAERLSLRIPSEIGVALQGIRFIGCGAAVEAEFPRGTALGVRRTALHGYLVEQAARAGAELRWQTPVQSLEQIRARWIVGADGAQSRARAWAGLDRCSRNSERFGFRRHFAARPWARFVEIYWGHRCQIFATPVAGQEVGISVLSRDPHLRLEDALQRFPELQGRLDGAPASSVERGSPIATRRLKTVTRGNVALIGDSSGSVDAITGDGVGLAFQQAYALANAFAAGDLTSYRAAHRRIARRPAFMANFMLLFDPWATVRSRGLHALAAHPELFAKLLAMHVGELSWPRFAGVSLQLGWRMLAGGFPGT